MVSNIQEGNKLNYLLVTYRCHRLSQFWSGTSSLGWCCTLFPARTFKVPFCQIKRVALTWTTSHCCSWTVLHCCSCTVLHFLSSTVLHSSPHSGSRKHSSDTFVVSLTREQVFPFCLRGPASGWGTPHTRWEAARRRRKDWNNKLKDLTQIFKKCLQYLYDMK